ncbi:MAG TPA: hypothetical protein VM537_19315, partial [Anaerolineae bacterium]|nr:hypothetical protein [Anaerolineae bacterium]
MVESLETSSRNVVEEYLANICMVGGEAMPDASALTQALVLCKDAAEPILRHACGPDSGAARALVSELDAPLRRMVGRLTSMCTTEMGRQLHDERARVEMLLDMAQTVSSTLELD